MVGDEGLGLHLLVLPNHRHIALSLLHGVGALGVNQHLLIVIHVFLDELCEPGLVDLRVGAHSHRCNLQDLLIMVRPLLLGVILRRLLGMVVLVPDVRVPVPVFGQFVILLRL